MPKVLLIEKEPDIRKLFQLYTKDSIYETLTAESKDEAIRLDQEEQPELVLIDPILPEWNPLKTSKKPEGINKNRQGPTHRIIFSVIPRKLIEEELNKSGLDGYISKLLPSKSLIEELDNYIE